MVVSVPPPVDTGREREFKALLELVVLGPDTLLSEEFSPVVVTVVWLELSKLLNWLPENAPVGNVLLAIVDDVGND